MRRPSALRPVFRALGSPERLRIVTCLGGESLNASEIADILHVTPASVRHHARRLLDAELLEVDEESYPRRYRLSNRVKVARYQRKLVYSVTVPEGEQLVFSLPRES